MEIETLKMDIHELKQEIINSDPREFVEKHIIHTHSNWVTPAQVKIIQDEMSKATGITIKQEEVHIVGSAKLGFGLFEKRRTNQPTLPAFRPFSGESDIDIAFASPALFDVIWNEIAAYATTKPWMPYRMNKLGDYLIYGWIRPDHVPYDARLRTYDTWRDTIRKLNASNHFGRRKVSGALYRDLEFLIKYQARGISNCKANLELT